LAEHFIKHKSLQEIETPMEAAPSRTVTPQVKRRKPVGNPLQGLVNATQAAGRPWWAETFYVAAVCAKTIYAPVRIVGDVANTLVALTFVGVFALVGLVLAGYIPDAVIVKYLSMVGDRVLSLIQASGLLQQ
jgi:hypothetical protein